MVLLDEDPHKLLASVQENFGIDGDMATITRITDQRRCLRDDRTKKHEQQQQHLRTLARKLNLARQSYTDTQADHEAKQHSNNMMGLDRTKFALAKNVNDLESNVHALEGHLAKLKEELENLQNDDPMERAVLEAADDGTTFVPRFGLQDGSDTDSGGGGNRLKLRVFRGLGIELQDDGAGVFKKAVVRNRATGDFNIVNIEGKFSSYFYANYFWGLLQSGCDR